METIKIKTDITKLPNKMHFEIQRKTRAHVFLNKKKKDPKYKQNYLLLDL